MRLLKVVLCALTSVCVSLPMLAQNITFDNSDGTFTGTSVNSGTLSLGNLTTGNGDSTLTSISGFMGNLAGYNTSNNAGLGTLAFTTGALMSTTGCATPPCGTDPTTMVPLQGETSMFGPGGTFKVVDTFNGGYGGFVFKGAFSAEQWQCEVGIDCHAVAGNPGHYRGIWTFSGSLAAGTTLTIDGQKFMATTPGTVQLTSVGSNGALGLAVVNSDGSVTFEDSGGHTNFGGNFQISPEPGTLVLFGSGLIALAGLAKRKVPTRS